MKQSNSRHRLELVMRPPPLPDNKTENPRVCWVCIGLRTLLGILFLVSGTLKASDFDKFFQHVKEFQFFQEHSVYQIAWLATGAEVLLGLFLISGFATKIFAWVGIGMVSSYTLLLLSAWWRGLSLNCVCFGPLEFGVGYPEWFLRNLILIALFLVVAIRSPHLAKPVTAEDNDYGNGRQ